MAEGSWIKAVIEVEMEMMEESLASCIIHHECGCASQYGGAYMGQHALPCVGKISACSEVDI